MKRKRESKALTKEIKKTKAGAIIREVREDDWVFVESKREGKEGRKRDYYKCHKCDKICKKNNRSMHGH